MNLVTLPTGCCIRFAALGLALLVVAGCQRAEQLGPVAEASSAERIREAFGATVIEGVEEDASTETVVAGWGSLRGRFVFEGQPPPAESISITKDPEYCGKHDLKEETVTVSADGGLANAFVFLNPKRGETVAVHPDYDQPGIKPIILNNQGCRFEPHALVVYTAQPLEIRNSDPGVGHNTNGQTLGKNAKFNDMVSNQAPVTKKFGKSESQPAEIACSIHPWMKAYVLIRENPYMVVSTADGSFEIKNMPAGEHEFIFWHEAVKSLRGISVGGAETSNKGKVKLTIPADGELDLGEINVPSAALGG